MTPNDAIVLMLMEFVQRERARRDAIGKGGQHVNGNAPTINVSTLHELERMIRDAPYVVIDYNAAYTEVTRLAEESSERLNMLKQAIDDLIVVRAERDAALAEVEAAFRAGWLVFACGTSLTADEAWADYQQKRGMQ